MRVAFIDLTFHWPPSGGSWVDLYKVITGLQQYNYEVFLYVPYFQYGIVPRGKINEPLPFPIYQLTFTKYSFNFLNVVRKFRIEIIKNNPDIIFIANAYSMKPYLGLAFKDYPVIQRFYGHELLCPNYIGLIKNGKICNTHYLKTPLYCTQCALRMMRYMYVHHGPDEFIHEFIAGLGFLPTYWGIVKRSLEKAAAIIVYNQWSQEIFSIYNPNVFVIPGGVDTEFFHPVDSSKVRLDNEKKIIFMPGRVFDPRKGLSVLKDAVVKLKKKRNDFHVIVTDSEKYDDGIVKSTGWLSQKELAELYKTAYICVVPSAWHEPFGLVALEAMASGVPVIASDVGGLRDIVRDNVTGYLVPINDSEALAQKIEYLLDHPEVREKMGKLAREVATEEFDWNKIIIKYYLPLFERIKLKRNNESLNDTSS